MPSTLYHAQAEMALERVEIAVAVKQRMAVPDAEGRDQRIDGRADGDASSSQEPVIPRRADRNFTVHHGGALERPEAGERACGVVLGAEPLQNLGKNQIPDQQPSRVHQTIEQIGFGAGRPVEVVDPDGGIDQDHSPMKRLRRIAFKSPSQRSLPRSARIFDCSLTLSSKRNPDSTASRLVLAPDARIARFIKSSSMTILVRI